MFSAFFLFYKLSMLYLYPRSYEKSVIYWK